MDLSKHLEKAEEALKRRNYALAIGLYQQILDLDPDAEEARAGLRRALDRKFEGKKGGGVLATVQGSLPLLSAGIAKLFRSHTARARSLERFLALAPGHVGANLKLGDALYRGGHRRSAFVVYRHLGERLSAKGQSGAHAEQAGLAWRSAGAIAQELRRLEDAMSCLEAALKINPRDQEALRARKNLAAEGVLESGGYAKATSARDLARDKDAVGQREKGQRLQRSAEEIATELAEAEKRLVASPEDPALLRQVGELRAQKGDLGGALDCLEAALAKEPGDAALSGRVGELRLREIETEIAKAQRLGDAGKVERLQKKLSDTRLGEARRRVEAHPTDLGARLDLGRALQATGSHEAAIAELQRAVKDPRCKLEALLSLGECFRARGMLDLARGQYEKALEAAGPHHSRSLDILYELGCLAEQQDQSDEARRFFSRIVEVDIGYKDVSKRLQVL